MTNIIESLERFLISNKETEFEGLTQAQKQTYLQRVNELLEKKMYGS